MSAALLHAKGVSISFGGLKALQDVHLELRPNEVVGVIGPNGAGKTTLFNAICGLVTPDSGTLELNGKDRAWPRTDELVDLGISRTLQGVGLFPELTVLENVMVGAQRLAKTGLISAALGSNKKDEEILRDKAMRALDRVYAGTLANRRADTLAYPDTKRVAIARALVSEPKILMLDEPAGGLGPQDIEWMNNLIRNLTATMSVLIVEHHMDVVMTVCDRLYVLNFGEVISSGDAEKVRRDPAVIASYLGTGVAEMLTIKDLSVDHGAIRALHGVSFKVEKGQLAAVIGANGAGKTTLLRALSGLNKASQGQAHWGDHNILHSKPEALVRHGIS
ncbi:MAG: ATP-binding cassette domain-containing protein, partial [Actinobacteria bacterium]|nr:ATP-binding cassette domain-containing protein [Actinomycetota bacterium]